jgi:hypothetical protein
LAFAASTAEDDRPHERAIMPPMDALHEELLGIERALGGGTGDTYREHLAEDAVVVVPGAAITREQCAAAIDETPGWDDFEITDDRIVRPNDDTAILTYRWRSSRGDYVYESLMSSVYARRAEGGWKLVLHQQTPVTP